MTQEEWLCPCAPTLPSAGLPGTSDLLVAARIERGISLLRRGEIRCS